MPHEEPTPEDYAAFGRQIHGDDDPSETGAGMSMWMPRRAPPPPTRSPEAGGGLFHFRRGTPRARQAVAGLAEHVASQHTAPQTQGAGRIGTGPDASNSASRAKALAMLDGLH